ncbi:MAG: acetolactate synthase small subunit [bacterium]|jgi:acetolactate synthase-1/3 small subunit|nr:acetolactate synthase small subunit [bacterium]MDD3805164.1 acetolactate synthase small subunit [bacterium]MDD4152481.1 acetolactate synthase small subunit [bacterium]MDD4557630.1 acetolactate synthase small subunit [bacterium]
MRHTLSVLVSNHPGVLTRVSGLFARRGFNIESLSVNSTENPDTSRMTIVVEGDVAALEQIRKQIHKLVEVIKVYDHTEESVVERELALIKVSVETRNRNEIMQITDIFRGKIVDVSDKAFVVEITGSEDKINAIEQLFRPFGIKEIVRTGKIVLARGSKNTE